MQTGKISWIWIPGCAGEVGSRVSLLAVVTTRLNLWLARPSALLLLLSVSVAVRTRKGAHRRHRTNCFTVVDTSFLELEQRPIRSVQVGMRAAARPQPIELPRQFRGLVGRSSGSSFETKYETRNNSGLRRLKKKVGTISSRRRCIVAGAAEICRKRKIREADGYCVKESNRAESVLRSGRRRGGRWKMKRQGAVSHPGRGSWDLSLILRGGPCSGP
jgi:hypothetical protein